MNSGERKIAWTLYCMNNSDVMVKASPETFLKERRHHWHQRNVFIDEFIMIFTLMLPFGCGFGDIKIYEKINVNLYISFFFFFFFAFFV